MAKDGMKLRRMEIEPAQNGGHTVTHHFKETARHSPKMGIQAAYHEPESHVFGPEDGHEMLAHIANHLHIKEVSPEHEGEPDTGDGEEE